MDLTHRFTVPTSIDDTWAHFNDIASVAECFPGAKVTSVEDEIFHGEAKVKLGPIALVYKGTGAFKERDESAHRMLIEAKGKDKRGNGTAGADVTMTMTEAADGATEVEVITDLQVTGKPAQFGRGVMQDVSDKLLGQFVSCLEQRLGEARATLEVESEAAAAGPSGEGAPPSEVGSDSAPSAMAGGDQAADRGSVSDGTDDDALDLGATVLPVLAKAYWKQAVLGLLAVVVIRWLLRRWGDTGDDD